MTTTTTTTKYTPAYLPSTTREPNKGEKKIDVVFQEFIKNEIKLESDEEMDRRNVVLDEVKSIFLQFVQHIATKVLHLPADEAEDAGGELFISGSHRLGVRDVGADIDTICVAPSFCTKEHFFTHLKEDFAKRPEVTELIAVEDARVPIMSFDYKGVSIDLLFSRLAISSVPKNLDLLDDNILNGLDPESERTLNGPRVTNMIIELVGQKSKKNFLIVLRCIRKWAKARGLYGNKLGYLGGVNCNILVAFICQLYPNFNATLLLFSFFKTFKAWKWPEPICLNNIQKNPPGDVASETREVWSKEMNDKDLMPIITPAYPASNSTYNVSRHTLHAMQREIERGHSICHSILNSNAWENPNSWHKLFEPTDFFLRYKHYLACHIIGTGDNLESRGWKSYVEAKIRRFTQVPYLETLPIKVPIHLHPVVSKTKKSADSICYFIGFDFDLDFIKANGNNQIHIDEVAARFHESLITKYNKELSEGLDFYVEHLTWKKLPKEVFETFGGYEEAKRLRDEMGFNKVAVAEETPVAGSTAATAKETEATKSIHPEKGATAIPANTRDGNAATAVAAGAAASSTEMEVFVEEYDPLLAFKQEEERKASFLNFDLSVRDKLYDSHKDQFKGLYEHLIESARRLDERSGINSKKRKIEMISFHSSPDDYATVDDVDHNYTIPNMTWVLSDNK